MAQGKKPKRQASSKIQLEKQQLSDLEQRISMDFGTFLVLKEEGTEEQISTAHARAKSDLLKFGPDMRKLAMLVSDALLQDVDQFLDSIDTVLLTSTGWIDEAQINQCYKAIQKLEKDLL